MPPLAAPHAGTTAPLVRRFALAATAILAIACDVNPFDRTQVPRITVTPVIAAPLVVIAWTPTGANLVRVYKGTTAGQGYGEALVWSIAATSGNSLMSSVEYGTSAALVGATTDVAAKPLILGQPYTVEVSRTDPKGTGSGFTSTGNRYVSTQTFTIAALRPAP